MIQKIVYNKFMGEIWLWMIFVEWIYYSLKNKISI